MVKNFELTQQILELKAGDHLCLFYEKDPAEQLPALVPFLRDGLARDEQCIYVADDYTRPELAARLREHGIEVDAETQRGRLKLWTRQEWRQPGRLDSAKKARQVRETIAAALAAGFQGIRFAVEMTWTLGPDIGARELEHWEATINTIFLPGVPGRIICQYNCSRHSPEVLVAALHTHRLAIIGDEMYVNAFYEAPLILQHHDDREVAAGPLPSGRGSRASEHPFVGANGRVPAAVRLDWMLTQLRAGRAAERARKERFQACAAPGGADRSNVGIAASEMAPARDALPRTKPELEAQVEELEQLRARAQFELAERRRAEQRLTLQYNIARTLADASTLPEALEEILRTVCEEAEWQVGAIWLVEQPPAALRCLALYHRPNTPMPEFAAETRALRLARGEGIPGRVWESARPSWMADLAAEPPFPRLRSATRAGLKAALAFPLRIDQEIVGVMEFFGGEVRPHEEDFMSLAHAIGSQVGQFIERKLAERALRISEERFRLAAHSDAITLYEQDAALRYTWLYPRHAEHAHALGKTEEELSPTDDGKLLAACKRQVMETGVSQRLDVRRTLGSAGHYYDLFVSPRCDELGAIVGVAGAALDITERKRAEHGLRQLAAIVESSDDAIISKDLNGVVQSWNQGAERLLGYTAEEMIGRSIVVVIPPERRDEELHILGRIRRGERIEHFETVRRRKDGADVELSLTVSPVKDEAGKIVGASKIARDITERKRVERTLRETQEQLTRANQELESRVHLRTASLREAIEQMEEFSYSVSHDLRSPVRAMQGYASAVLADYGERIGDEGRDFLQRIVRNAGKMDRLIQDLLTYTRISRREIQLQAVSLDKLVREIIEQYPDMHASRAEILIAGCLPEVTGHEPSLSQAISNLLQNAVKFVHPGQVPRVAIAAERRDDQVRLWIEDNGIGIKPQYQDRLFGMFERIHPEKKYEGTGIGLAIVRKALERMGGRAGVESDGVTGSRFWIQCPAASPP